MAWYWLSFADPQPLPGKQFLGVALVEGVDFLAAVRAAHVWGCNPGGEVMGYILPSELHVPECYANRLLTAAEADALKPEDFRGSSDGPPG